MLLVLCVAAAFTVGQLAFVYYNLGLERFQNLAPGTFIGESKACEPLDSQELLKFWRHGPLLAFFLVENLKVHGTRIC